MKCATKCWLSHGLGVELSDIMCPCVNVYSQMQHDAWPPCHLHYVPLMLNMFEFLSGCHLHAHVLQRPCGQVALQK